MPFSHLEQIAGSILETPAAGERRVSGLQGGARAYFLSLVLKRRDAPVLVIAPTPREAERLFLDLAFFLGEAGDLPLL